MKEQRPFSQPFSQMTQYPALSSAVAGDSTGLSCGAGGGRDLRRADTPAIALLPRPRPCCHTPAPAVTHFPWQAVSHPFSLGSLPRCHPLSLAGRQSPLLPHPFLRGHSCCCSPPAITPFPWRAATLPHHSSVLLNYSLLYRCHPLSSVGGRPLAAERPLCAGVPGRPLLLCSLFWRTRPFLGARRNWPSGSREHVPALVGTGLAGAAGLLGLRLGACIT